MVDAIPTAFNQLIAPSARFQRAVDVRYDLRDADSIERYIPTNSAVEAISAILRGTKRNGTQRAHVLHAAYGSGKSLLAVALAALLEKDPVFTGPTNQFVQRIRDTLEDVGNLAQEYLEGPTRLFP